MAVYRTTGAAHGPGRVSVAVLCRLTRSFCLDLSYLYSKLVTAYTRGVEHEVHAVPSASGETTPLLPIGVARHHLSPAVLQFMSMWVAI